MKDEYWQYYTTHRTVLDKMKVDAIASVPCQRSVYKMVYECECGASVVCKNLQFHFVSKKHRDVCGDLDSSAVIT
jgi:hypothetical protein